jgi:hypothetical protein
VSNSIAVEATQQAGAARDLAADRPYAPAWLHRLIDWIDRLPVPTWIAYLVIAIVSILVIHTQVWMIGAAPVGTFDVANTYWGVLPVALIWTAGYLERVAGEAFDAFRPALDRPDHEAARLRYELTVVPARPAMLIALGALALTGATYVLDPVGIGVASLPIPAMAGRFVLESFNGSILFLVLYQLIRQMRQVGRTLARSAVVDLFQPGPIYAFSKLTSRAGIAIVALVGSTAIATPIPTDPRVFLVYWAPYLVLPPVLAAIAFIVPLYGMHGRLVAEKDRLQGEAEARLRSVLGEFNRDVDARELSRVDGLNKALATMLQQREVLARLPTWPWSAGTLRTFITAILLPIGLFLIQRLLSQFV